MRPFYLSLLTLILFIYAGVPRAQDCEAMPVPSGVSKPGNGLSCIEGGVSHMLVEQAYSYPTAPKQKNGAVFMSIKNSGENNLRVVSATSDISEKVELHTHLMDGDIMMMREVEHYDIPAHGTVALEPMGHHIMLLGLNKQLKKGDSFVLYLNMEDEQRYVLNVKIGQPDHEKNSDH